MNTTVKPVSGFQTSDGRLHRTRAEAETHQAKLDFYAFMAEQNVLEDVTPIADAIWRNFNVVPRA